MKAMAVLESAKKEMERDYNKDHDANRLGTVINDLAKKYGADIYGVLQRYAGCLEAEYRYLKSVEAV